MGMVAAAAGSFSLLRGGCSCSCYHCCSSNYHRPLLALFPSANAAAAATSTWLSSSWRRHLYLGLKDNTNKIIIRTAAAAATPSFSILPLTNPNYYAKLTSPNTPNNAYTRTTRLGWNWKCHFSSSNVADKEDEGLQKDVEDDDVDDEMTKGKQAANTLDIRVGKILKAWRHPEADSLYVEEVDVGEPEPRIICSGLVKCVPLDHLQGINVVVLANLKPRNMRGVKSSGMLMAASDASHENVELLVPPQPSVPGQRIWFGSLDEKESLPDAASPNQIQKKKIWELVQPHLGTDHSCVAALGMHTMRTTEGVVVCRSLKNARIS